MSVEYMYDASGKPVKVILPYDEYQELVSSYARCEDEVRNRISTEIADLLSQKVNDILDIIKSKYCEVSDHLVNDEDPKSESPETNHVNDCDVEEIDNEPKEIGGSDPELTYIKPEDDYISISKSILEYEKKHIRKWKSSEGYYEGIKFRVLKGSKAESEVSSTFNTKRKHVELRNRLIEQGILKKDTDYSIYTFTEDYVFDSSSAAACIIAGNSRSGPQAFGKPITKL